MKIVLLGAGGHASDVLAALEAMLAAGATGLEIVGYAADGEIGHHRFAGRGVAHVGGLAQLRATGATHFIACVGYPAGRAQVARQGHAAGLAPFTVVHPRAWVPPTASVGPGSVVLAGACLSPLTRLGAHVVVGQGAILGHDCVVGDFASVMPGACVSGDTLLGEGCLVGANATVLEKLSVGAHAAVGAGAVVTRDVPAHHTAVGVPARLRDAAADSP